MGTGFNPRKEYEDIALKAAETCGYTIYEMSVRLKGDNSRIMVKIDRVEGISHHDCQHYTREISRLLDENGTLPNYSLEISSPGLTRRLSGTADFLRFTGSLVKVIYRTEKGGRVAKGKIAGIEGESLKVDSAEEKREIIIPFSDIEKANLDF